MICISCTKYETSHLQLIYESYSLYIIVNHYEPVAAHINHNQPFIATNLPYFIHGLLH